MGTQSIESICSVKVGYIERSLNLGLLAHLLLIPFGVGLQIGGLTKERDMNSLYFLRLFLLVLLTAVVTVVFPQSPQGQDPLDNPFGGPSWDRDDDPRQPQQNPLIWVSKSADRFRSLEAYFHSLALQEEQLRAEERREEMLKIHELRQKAAELVETSYKLHQRLQNPFAPHDEPAELIQKSEKLAKSISKLMR